MDKTTVNLSKTNSAAYRHVLELDGQVAEALAAAGVDGKLVELVKLRVSQLNGCAYCLRMHTRDAIKKGESADRLAVVTAWWESQYFTAQERAALGLAEEVTKMVVPERADWDDGSLTPEQISAISWLAIVTGVWNRVAVRSHYPVAP
ncbi:carboxymuconolactone decarboxylase family protein [Microbacterium sp. TWP3-1-2b2]|uniref:carboxymuconolactone decarboxylase family protein n=1 Tax=Microbacterium sp. TWP3-1-2b2 TaxID=2804651 RepID=UPI003CED0829